MTPLHLTNICVYSYLVQHDNDNIYAFDRKAVKWVYTNHLFKGE